MGSPCCRRYLCSPSTNRSNARQGPLSGFAICDEEWLEHCGTRGRIAVSHNSQIRDVHNELAAVKRFKVPLLIVVGKATAADLAHNFVRTLPRIEAFLSGRAPPFIGKVYRATPAELARSPSAPGRVELWFPKA